MDRGDSFLRAFTARKDLACIHQSKRNGHILHYTLLYRIENIFGQLKDWLRIYTRYDRCARTLMTTIDIAATIIFSMPNTP